MKTIYKYLVLMIILIASVYGQIKISYVGGEAYFQRNNLRQRITFGTELKPGDMIITSDRSFVALLFDDGSVHKVTANTQYEIREYQNTKDSRLQVFNLLKGKIFSFVNKTFKKSDIKFLTPTAVVGVRGTSFVTEVNQEGTTVYMIEGSVDFSYAGSSTSIPLKQGEKGRAAGGNIKKDFMQKQDYESAAQDVPVSLAAVKVKEAVEEEDVNAEKDIIRNSVDQSINRQEEQRQQITENTIWKRDYGEYVNGYKIDQSIERVAVNKIKIVNSTKKGDKENSLVLGITFTESLPTVSTVQSGNSVTRDIKEIEWDIKVSEGKGYDQLVYNRNYVSGGDSTSETVSFNGNEGSGLNSLDYTVSGANARIPKWIEFKINDESYKFDFTYTFEGRVGRNNIVKDISELKASDTETFGFILNSQLDTHIEITAKLPKGADSKFLKRGGDTNFRIILLNDYLMPLFDSIAL